LAVDNHRVAHEKDHEKRDDQRWRSDVESFPEEARPEEPGGRRSWAIAALSLVALVSVGCVVAALMMAGYFPERGPAAAGARPQAFAVTGGPVADGGAFALQARTDALQARALLGPPTRLQPAPDGSRLADLMAGYAEPFGPPLTRPAGGLAAVRWPLWVATGVLALLSVVQLGRLAVASWRGELFAPQHGQGLRRLAWLTLLIGLAHVSSIVLQLGAGPPGRGAPLGDMGVASGAVLASLFLFFFAHAVSEGARIADDHLHTV
jgi:hypothetical protein